MTYVIEGTISELSVNESNTFTCKVSGREGYAIRQGKDKKLFNLLCSNEKEVLKTDPDFSITFPAIFQSIMIASLTFGKIVRIELEETSKKSKIKKTKIKIDNKTYNIKSVSLLSE